MKAIVGAVVGLVLAAATQIGAEAFAKIDSMWPAALAGGVVGAAMRVIGASGRASVLRGALAAVVALASVILGKAGAAKVIQQMGPPAPVVASPAAMEGEDDADKDPKGAAAETEPLMAPDGTQSNPAPFARPPKSSNETVDTIWLAVSALLAYQLGKGANRPGGQPQQGDAAGSPPVSSPVQDPAD